MKKMTCGLLLIRALKFRTCTHKIAQKANKVLEVINCSFKYLNPDIMCLLYPNPHLDYACNAWNPYLLQDMCTIEKIQCRVTKLISSFKQYSYYERLSLLNPQ